jgi:predicted ATPase
MIRLYQGRGWPRSNMQIKTLRLDNWKNFRHVALDLERRVFVVGPNASGKSNLLDALRFLRDIADPEGGFQRAVRSRGGVSQIRCLHARKLPDVALDTSLQINGDVWNYKVEFAQDNQRRAVVRREEVRRNDTVVLSRPDDEDEKDSNRLTQTHLEQVSANKDFRPVSAALAGIRYLHVVPQLVREPERVAQRVDDPYGSDFLQRIAQTSKRVLESRLKRINAALKVAVPQLRELKIETDERGIPHLKGLYGHWRPNAGWQSEDQFSDGTLRLLGLLWAFLDGSEPLLLEEPELSLHAAVVRHIPAMMISAGRKSLRQIIVSTHSADLLSDGSIGPEEVVLLTPTDDGTIAQLASSIEEVKALLEGDVPLGEAVMPRTSPRDIAQLALFGSEL